MNYIKISLIVWLTYLLICIIKNLIFTFSDKTLSTKIKSIIEYGIDRYIRDNYMCKFFACMFWLYVCIRLLIAVFNNNIIINKL